MAVLCNLGMKQTNGIKWSIWREFLRSVSGLEWKMSTHKEKNPRRKKDGFKIKENEVIKNL